MKNTTKWFVVAALATTGIFAFACGGGSAEGGGGTTTPSATVTATATASASGTAMTTATATTTAAPTATTPPAPPLVVSAMKLVDPKGKHSVEIKDDGSVMGDGKPVAKFVGAELQDKDGKTLVAVAADGTVKMDGATKTVKFNEKDELVIGDGAKLIIGDDGVVKMLNPDGKADKDSGKVKVTGFKPTARRSATVFVLAMMMMNQTPTATAATTVSAATTTAPPAKK